MIKPRVSFVLTIGTVALLWWQARQPVWNNHLQVDIWVFWERLNYWLNNLHSFAGLTGNEILPTTLLYLFVPIALIPVGLLSYANYLPAMLLTNLVVLGMHWLIINRKEIFLVCLLFLGPILLFRFDALVTLTILLAFMAFIKERYKLSGFWLGLATGMKVFPVIFLPYLVLILVKQNNRKALQKLLIFFGEALLLPVFIFLLLGGSLEQVAAALAFHSQKLISIESVPGSLITGWSLLFSGSPPDLIPGNGIWAVPGPAALLNRLWMIPIALVYAFICLRQNLLSKFSWTVPFVLVLVFLVFSKNLNPQYLWWFMVFLPFIKPSRLMLMLVLGSALLNQLVFPLFYNTFVEDFYRQNLSYWVYYLLLLRNAILVVITYLSGRKLLNEY